MVSSVSINSAIGAILPRHETALISMHTNSAQIRDIRTLPFLWIHRALLDTIRPTWRAILAYTALAYYANSETATCKQIGIRELAERVAISEDTMKRGLDELAKKKAIQIRHRYKQKNGKRQQLPNEYILINLVAPPKVSI